MRIALAPCACLAIVFGMTILTAAARAQAQPATPPPVHVANDGTVSVSAQDVPLSSLLSPEAKAYVTQHLRDMQDPEALKADNGIPHFMQPYLARMKVMYPVPMQETQIGGVHVYDFHGERTMPRESADQPTRWRILRMLARLRSA